MPNPGIIRILSILGLLASLASLGGAFRAALVTTANGYAGMAFTRTVLLVFRSGIGKALLLGMVLFLAFLLIRGFLSLVLPQSATLRCASWWSRQAGGGPARLVLPAILSPFLWFLYSALREASTEPGFQADRPRIVLAWILWVALLYLVASKARRVLQLNSLEMWLSLYFSSLFFLLCGTLVFSWTGLQPSFEALLALGCTSALAFLVLVSWFISRRSGRWILLSTGPAVVGLGFCLLAPFLAEPSLRPTNPHNVILIGIDTLRADHTSMHSAARRAPELTPSLLELAGRSVTFEAAISQAPWTMPAFASILTGLYPADHRALSFLGLLAQEQVTLAEVLREAGFATGAIVSHDFVSETHGFGQGFEHFDSSQALGHWAVTSAAVTDRAVRWVGRRDTRPFFLFLHYFDPHYEFRDHDSWTFADSYDGWLKNEAVDINYLRHQRHLLDARDVQYLRDLYDEEIAFTDQQVGRLLAFLRSSGLEETTAVVVVGDHGEEFLERGWLGHTITLYEEVIRVPMVLHFPGLTDQGGRVSRPVETRALFMTLLDYLGVSWDAPAAAGSLVGLFQDPSAHMEEHQPLFSSVWLPDEPSESGKRSILSAVRLGDWKLIIDATRRKDFLFNLAEDPLENRNLKEERRGEYLELLGLHSQWLAKQTETRPARRRTLSDQEVQRLKALGYL